MECCFYVFWSILGAPSKLFQEDNSHIVRGTPNVQCSFPVCFLLPLWAYRKPSMENYWKNVFIGWLVPGFSKSFMTLIDASWWDAGTRSCSAQCTHGWWRTTQTFIAVFSPGACCLMCHVSHLYIVAWYKISDVYHVCFIPCERIQNRENFYPEIWNNLLFVLINIITIVWIYPTRW